MITGITGQDGAYLAENLLSRGEEVFGAVRRSSHVNTGRLKELGIEKDIKFIDLDLIEQSNIFKVVEIVKPSRIYNLAAQSFVKTSFDQPIYTAEINSLGVSRLLDAIRIIDPKIKFYQASTSEMYGAVRAIPQNELTPFNPRSPYAISKLFSHFLVSNYREAYNMHCCSGILFNHESPLRGIEFVTRKISVGMAEIKLGIRDELYLGNLDSKRDWGYAKEYVEGMRLMLDKDDLQDYVLATGVTTTVRSFISYVAEYLGMDIVWEGAGVSEVGYNSKNGKLIIRINENFFRPTEVEELIGDSSKAKRDLGWQCVTTVQQLAHMMVEADIKRLSK
jgi:GDPmannose 4,6-dehydratase